MTPDSISKLLRPYVDLTVNPDGDPTSAAVDWPRLYAQLSVYLGLILKWNARTNLTAIRTPEDIVRRHFGESLFAGAHVGCCSTLLDYGSGAGFPGIPIQLLRPEVQVTLAESQGKKAAFLQEVIRSLGLATEVWSGRVETMPAARQFDVVALRAVDNMDAAIRGAGARARERVLILGTASQSSNAGLGEFSVSETVPLPESKDGVLLVATRR